MKKLLCALLALGSLSSFAMTDFEINLLENSNTFTGSENYEAKYTNDDGSISIIKPKFSNPEGNGSLYISAASDLGGLCKLYGLGRYVPNSIRALNKGPVVMVRINSNARFSQFDYSSGISAIDRFTCEPIGGIPYPALVSDNHAGFFHNDDGSTTIVKPEFQINGSSSYISESSDLNGLCKLYGFGSYVPNSKRIFNQGPVNIVRINSNARFSKFDYSSFIYAIKSLMCY